MRPSSTNDSKAKEIHEMFPNIDIDLIKELLIELPTSEDVIDRCISGVDQFAFRQTRSKGNQGKQKPMPLPTNRNAYQRKAKIETSSAEMPSIQMLPTQSSEAQYDPLPRSEEHKNAKPINAWSSLKLKPDAAPPKPIPSNQQTKYASDEPIPLPRHPQETQHPSVTPSPSIQTQKSQPLPTQPLYDAHPAYDFQPQIHEPEKAPSGLRDEIEPLKQSKIELIFPTALQGISPDLSLFGAFGGNPLRNENIEKPKSSSPAAIEARVSNSGIPSQQMQYSAYYAPQYQPPQYSIYPYPPQYSNPTNPNVQPQYAQRNPNRARESEDANTPSYESPTDS